MLHYATNKYEKLWLEAVNQSYNLSIEGKDEEAKKLDERAKRLQLKVEEISKLKKEGLL